MTVHSVSHVAVGVRDMDRSLAFYRDLIGLDVRNDCIEEFGASEGHPAVRRRGAYLQWSDDPHAPFIVLDQQISPGVDGEAKELYERGIHHFGFWVDNVEDVATRARAVDVPFVYGPADTDTSTYGEPAGGTIRLLMLRDPDGNIVQLDQRVTS
jgi:catechol 2,3-dioxygenase-like lactoylglutathione lyase family enzyme